MSEMDTPFAFFIPNIDQYWLADLFVVEVLERIYFFFELYDRKRRKGTITYSELKNGEVSTPHVIIDEPFHLSFPCIFELDKKWYLVPETGESRNIYIYECVEFPEKWIRRESLLSDISSSDTICFSLNQKDYILPSLLINHSARSAENYLYILDPRSNKLTL